MRWQGSAGLTDERTIAQLASILHCQDARGRVKIESKDEARKRGVKSPDRAEAVILAFAQPAGGWIMLNLDEPDLDAPPAGATLADRIRAESRNLTRQVSSFIQQFRDDSRGDGHCGECAHMRRRGGDEGGVPCESSSFAANDPECDAFEPRSVD